MIKYYLKIVYFFNKEKGGKLLSNAILQLISISIYMIGMLLIGWYAYNKTKNLTDYMLGGRSLGPAVTALSAGAADMSGWLLMGLPRRNLCNRLS